jgi:hypothetical protein
MTVLLYSNNAKTTLAAPISSTATTITVAPGTGDLFPQPVSGSLPTQINQQFTITLNSISSPNVYEICACTARSGDTLTVIRGQEGTTATAFVLGDIVGNFDTAGTMSNLVQTSLLQTNYYSYVTAGGTANALTATLPSNLTTLVDGFSFIVKAIAANTTTPTLTLTLAGSTPTVLPYKAIVKGNFNALVAGDIAGAGYPIELIYSSEYDAYVMQNPANGAASPQFLATTNGFQVLPSGIILQWGQSSTTNGTGTITYPTPFPNNVWSIQTTIIANAGSGGWGVIEPNDLNASLSEITIYSADYGSAPNAPANGSFTVAWIAIGN